MSAREKVRPIVSAKAARVIGRYDRILYTDAVVLGVSSITVIYFFFFILRIVTFGELDFSESYKLFQNGMLSYIIELHNLLKLLHV